MAALSERQRGRGAAAVRYRTRSRFRILLVSVGVKFRRRVAKIFVIFWKRLDGPIPTSEVKYLVSRDTYTYS